MSNLGDLDRFFANQEKLDIVFAMPASRSLPHSARSARSHFDSLFDTNVKGLFFTVRKSLPLLSDGASVILNSSIVAGKGIPVNRSNRHQSRHSFVRPDLDNGPEGSPHSGERRQSRPIDTPGRVAVGSTEAREQRLKSPRQCSAWQGRHTR